MNKRIIDYLRGPRNTWHPINEANTTLATYWLNWRAYLCYIWIITLIAMCSYFIMKYKRPNNRRSRNRGQDNDGGVLYEDEGWKPSLKQIHPAWFMTYRIFAFLVLLTVIILNAIANGGTIFYYYTNWTFTLVVIYFGFGTFLSMYGCYHHDIDTEHQSHRRDVARLCGYVFQIIFQMVAGAVVLTDCIFWFIIVPFLARKHQNNFHFLPVAMHSMNVVFLFGDVVLNSLRFPWFRIAYFILWTCAFVIFQWILHACINLWWPYTFLDLSTSLSPLWYLLVALLHVPCYGFFFLLIKLKHFLLMKWFGN